MWPEGETQVALDNVKWMGAANAFNARLRAERSRIRRRNDDDDR